MKNYILIAIAIILTSFAYHPDSKKKFWWPEELRPILGKLKLESTNSVNIPETYPYPASIKRDIKDILKRREIMEKTQVFDPKAHPFLDLYNPGPDAVKATHCNNTGKLLCN